MYSIFVMFWVAHNLDTFPPHIFYFLRFNPSAQLLDFRFLWVIYTNKGVRPILTGQADFCKIKSVGYPVRVNDPLR
jgi:hypothetical protein